MRAGSFLLLAAAACAPSASGPDLADGGGGSGGAVPDARASASIDAAPQGPVSVTLTADNAYSFGYGDANLITHFTQGSRALTAGNIFNCPVGVGPEAYTIAEADAPDDAYLYVIAWDDRAVTQGVLGQFKRATSTLYTGDDEFEACATGLDYSGRVDLPADGTTMTGPTLAVINAEIAKCNAGSGDATTSRGWVDSAGAVTAGATGHLAVGEANDGPAGTFPQVCPASAANPEGIDVASRWMWYHPDDGGAADAFHSDGSNRFKAFIIFRLGVRQITIGRSRQ